MSGKIIEEEKKSIKESLESDTKDQSSINTNISKEGEEVVDFIYQRLVDLHQIYPQGEMTATIVYLGYDPGLDTKLILKRISKKKKQEKDYVQCRIEMEHIKLKHFNIVNALECIETQTDFYYTLEYLPDAAYFQEEIIENNNPIDDQLELKVYCTDILHALQYLHEEKGFVHLDLKLENIFSFIDPDNIRRVQIGDFGLMLKLDQETRTVKIPDLRGTSQYRAPEACENAIIKQNADLFGLGMILYYMNAGYLPKNIKKYNVYAKDSGEVPFHLNHWRNQVFHDLVAQLLQQNPTQRFQTAKQTLQHPWFQTL